MGIIATKKDDTLYSYFLKFEAINYWIFTLYVYGLKWGYVWHDAGPRRASSGGCARSASWSLARPKVLAGISRLERTS